MHTILNKFFILKIDVRHTHQHHLILFRPQSPFAGVAMIHNFMKQMEVFAPLGVENARGQAFYQYNSPINKTIT